MNDEIDAQLAQLKHDLHIKDYMLLNGEWYIIDFNSPEYIPVEVSIINNRITLKKK